MTGLWRRAATSCWGGKKKWTGSAPGNWGGDTGGGDDDDEEYPRGEAPAEARKNGDNRHSAMMAGAAHDAVADWLVGGGEIPEWEGMWATLSALPHSAAQSRRQKMRANM